MKNSSQAAANMKGCLFMLLAMAAFSLEDMFIKSAVAVVPLGYAVLAFGIGGALTFLCLMKSRGESTVPPDILSRAMLVRVICEIIGRSFFALAIILMPLSSASAILQATPLVVVLGAAVYMNEKISASHWLAIFAGFLGVLMIVRPGPADFNPASLFAVASTLGFAGRDLATRAASPKLSNYQLGFYGFLVLIASGGCLSLIENKTFAIDSSSAVQIAAAILFGVIAYNALTIAMRSGSISVVAPFRYSRVIFALILGIVIFDEQPDLMTLSGTLVIVISGIYILYSRRLKRAIAGRN
ncbi:DMT family transporter [Amphritea pacifica]|uniref:DMT family transporter n=1 Tax=Amphritea pacifica TaxID=2811233 RepID=A0ABS2WCW5_9GAMM|nr:DMT family transporter [Amphritea pacifica]MBN0989352.1 DMT family transporter [Amphritea pacifica]